jgi:hypothetical protein
MYFYVSLYLLLGIAGVFLSGIIRNTRHFWSNQNDRSISCTKEYLFLS